MCKEIMRSQQSGSADDMAALSGLITALHSIDWKSQYVWSYAWEAIDDMDVELASEEKSYYDAGMLGVFLMINILFHFIYSFCRIEQVDQREIPESHTKWQLARFQSVRGRDRHCIAKQRKRL